MAREILVVLISHGIKYGSQLNISMDANNSMSKTRLSIVKTNKCIYRYRTTCIFKIVIVGHQITQYYRIQSTYWAGKLLLNLNITIVEFELGW